MRDRGDNMKKYQFIVFMQDNDFNEVEKEIKTFFGLDDITYCLQYMDQKEKAIEILSRWDYGEYYTELLNEDEFKNEIGTAADIYYSQNSDYVLVSYGFLSGIALYRHMEVK